MRKPSAKTREWNRIHALNSGRRRQESNRKHKTKRKNTSANRRHSARSVPRQHLDPDWVRDNLPAIECPEEFSLESNFDAVVNVIARIRKQSTKPVNEGVYIDFRKIKHLSATAALVLAAELDRWNNLPGRRQLQSVDVHEWNDTVRTLLREMGFFQLLHVPGYVANRESNDHAVSYVKFRTGNRSEGKAINRLRRQNLEPLVGELPKRHHLFNAVSEAMTNVVQHAYKYRRHRPNRPNWWLAASSDRSTSQASIIIYDQGAGIPSTLPRTTPDVLKLFQKDDHARMIQAAHDLKRTASKEPHRGHGLDRNVRGYLNVLDCEASYRVVSLRGEYTYTRNREGETQHTLKSHSEPLNGTLIEWRVTVQ